MTLFKKGTKVRLTPKPSAKFSGEVVGSLREDYDAALGKSSLFELVDALTTFNGNAWDVEVVNELPTEDGWYLDACGWAFHYTKYHNLCWWGYSEPIDNPDEVLTAPYTRLVPEA